MIRRLLATGLIFMLFYTPPILGHRSLRLVIPIVALFFVLHPNYFKRYFLNRNFLLQYSIWIGITIYICLVGFLSGNGAEYIAPQVYWIVSVIPASIVVLCLIQKEGLGLKGLIDCSLIAGLAQSLIAIIALISPSVKQRLFTMMVEGHLIEEAKYIGEYYRRMYGYSGGLTFGMPALQAFLAMIALYMTINYNKKYCLAIPFLAISAIINARSTIVIFAICLIVILFQNNRNYLGKTFRLLVLCLLFTVAIALLMPTFKQVSPNTYMWVKKGIGELLLASTGDVSRGYFSYLFNKEKWIFPEGLGMIFGYGIRVMGNDKYGSATDVGFVNDMWFGGIIYIFVVYVLFISYCRHFKRLDWCKNVYELSNNIEGMGNYLFWSFLFNAVVLNLKTFIIDIHPLSMFFILLLIYVDLFYYWDLQTAHTKSVLE